MRYKTRNLKKQPPKKSATKRKTLITYKLPSTIYQKVLDELNDPSEKDHSVYSPAQIRQRCHQNIYSLFNTSEPVECNSNFLEAAKNSLEDRNFRVLYDIISKALDIRDAFLVQQLKQYMEYAILLDPKIENREEVMSSYVARVKMLNESHDKYISREHTLSQT